MHIRKNDKVKVLAGVDRKKEAARVVKVDHEKNEAIVAGRNLVWKHLRRSQDYPHGARVQKEAPIPVSKLIVVCEACGKASRVRFQVTDKAKQRVCGKCKKPLGGEQ